MSTLALTQEYNLHRVGLDLASGLGALLRALCVVACVVGLAILLGAVFAVVATYWLLIAQLAAGFVLIALFALATFPKGGAQ